MIIHYDVIGDIQDSLNRIKDVDPDWVDNRVKALVITKLEEAQLWATKLWKETKV